MSLTGQVLVLVLIFPAVSLLLWVLAVLERWVLSDLPRSKPYRLGRWRRQRAASSAGPAARSGRSAAA